MKIRVFGSCENQLDYTGIDIIPYKRRDRPFDSFQMCLETFDLFLVDFLYSHALFWQMYTYS